MKALDKHSGLTAERVRTIFHYEKSTGRLLWKALPHVSASSVKIGTEAGEAGNMGYRRVRLSGRAYQTHRLIWLYVYGEWPEDQIDHIDGNKANNRIANLRMASNALNRANSKTHSNNVLGLKGVQLHKQSGKYRARIFVNGKHKSLGLHHKIEDAIAAYETAAKDYFGAYARSK